MPPATVLSKLKKLSPTAFEHLVYDLMLLVGLRNATWRTPGADGGRDIEGDHLFVDLSDTLSLERWYIECKRYAHTLDWPTVYNKLAYAANHDADCLLLITTASLSPKCSDEVARHNSTMRRPRIRVWPGHVLEALVVRHPVLTLKYSLESSPQVLREALQPLSLLLSKVSQAAYGAHVTQRDATQEIEYAAAISELLSVRTSDAERAGSFQWQSRIGSDALYDWCTPIDNTVLSHFDIYGLRAALSAYRFIYGPCFLHISVQGMTLSTKAPVSSSGLERHLATLAPWTNFLFAFAPPDQLVLTPAARPNG
jgi:hypothetical protein